MHSSRRADVLSARLITKSLISPTRIVDRELGKLRTVPRGKEFTMLRSTERPKTTHLASTLAVLTGIALATVALAQSTPIGEATSAAERAARRSARIQELKQTFQAEHVHQDDVHIGTCLSLPEFSILFDNSTTDAELETYLEGLPDAALEEEFEAYQTQGSIWTTTATNGAVAQGNALTLTYSFVTDGTSIPATGNGDATANSNLFATMDANFPGGMNAFKTNVRSVFDRLEQLTNITYVEVTDDGAAFPTTAGALGARGDVRIAMKSLDGAGNILAVNYFPQFGGDMILDSGDIALFANSANNFIRIRNVIAHEHIHGLGLRHVIPENGTKLMEPSLVTIIDGPQEDDIRAVTFLYGDQYEPNNALNEEFFLGGPLNDPATNGVLVLEVPEASLERSDSKDFYGFTAFAGVPIALRVEPVGTTYDEGPQGGTALPLNAKAVRNLGLRLWRRVSAQEGTFSLLAQIDFNQAGVGEYHPPITYQLAGYMVGEIYSTDGVNASQRYRLRISNAEIDPTVEPPSMSVFDTSAGQQVNDGDTVQFGTVQIGESSNKTLTIVNGGPGNLEIGTIVVQGPAANNYDFTLIGTPTVPQGQSRSLALSFSPSATGARVAVMTIPNNDPTQPDFSFILSGTGAGTPAMVVRIDGDEVGNSGNFDFGKVLVGDTQVVTLQFQNTGTAFLNVSNLSFSGANATDFSTNLQALSLAPNATFNAALSFSPAEDGPRMATLTIANDAGLYSADLQGKGSLDCNTNGIPDEDDIDDGASEDCNENNVPDECETDSDGDGVIDDCDECPDDPDNIEEGDCGCGMPETDSNNDGVPDCLVVTVQGSNGAVWTLIPQVGTRLENVEALDPVTDEPLPLNVELPAGGITFEVHGVTPGGTTVVTIILDMPDGMEFSSFWKFGPDPDDAVPHWYEFLFDGVTGAVINDNVITLTLVDGGRGDHDGAANGIIVDPAAVAFVTEDLVALPPPTGGCGGGICGVGMGMGMMVPLVLIGLRSAQSARRARRIRGRGFARLPQAVDG